jgi:CheY-like chemotaxis protein
MVNPRSKGIVAFLREAKRRKVYVSAVAYAGVSVVLMELTGPIADALLFPDWVPRLVTFLLILGFPLVVVLAWTFDITGRGVVRTSDVDLVERGSGPAASSRSTVRPSDARPKLRGPRPPMPALRRRRSPSVAVTSGSGEDGEASTPDPERVRRATLAHVRHELRTPINGIIGYSEMLLEDLEEEAYTGDLERILTGGRRLLGLIDEVLGDGAAGSDGRDLESHAEKIRVDLRTPVTSVAGYAEMLLELAREEGRDDLISDLERIHASAHRLLELSGDIVGLATVGESASAVDGSAASELTRAVLSKIQSPGANGEGEAEGRLLVVDDNAMNRDLLSRQLARQGYVVLTASDGREALELLGTQTVDLILLDVIMPGMDGVETLRALKSDAKLMEIPVLMLSSLNEVDGALRCIEMGAEDYLSKPVKPPILDARIAANLELYRMRERERLFQERLAADEALIEDLLLGAFPEGAAERVRAGDDCVADVIAEATVLSCRARGLSAPSSPAGLQERVDELKALFLAAEALASQHGLETLVWREDGFLAVAGAPTPVEDHVERAAAMGRALLARGAALTGSGSEPLQLRLGLHLGPVLAAALGGRRLRYEVWGEAVKTAEGIAWAAPDGELLASPPVHARLRETLSFEPQKVRDISGTQMRTYRLREGVAAEGD